MDYKLLKKEVQEALVIEAHEIALKAARLYSDPKDVVEYTMEQLHKKGDYEKFGLWHWGSMHRAAEPWHFLKIIESRETRDLVRQAIEDAIEDAKEEKEEAAFEEAVN